MKKIISIVLGGSLLLSLNSCEWFNTSILGNPSKKEIAEKKAKEREKARADSLARAAELSLNEEKQNQPVTNETKIASNLQRYHIIVGCFLKPENAANMMTLLRNKGYQPTEFTFSNGYAGISAQSFSNLADSFNAMYDMLRRDDFCPDDVWIYDITQQLHR